MGKGKRQILKTNDIISITPKKIEIYTFKDYRYSSDTLVNFPNEITNKYYLDKVSIGYGSYGSIYKAYDYSTCDEFAIKRIHKDPFLNHQREADIMGQLKHPCIVELFEIVDRPTAMFIRMELMAETLYDRINANGQLPERQAKFFFYQLCTAIEYMHGQKIVHRDLKPKNVLLESATEDYTRSKIIDFGLSKTDSQLKTICGTGL